MIEIEAGAPESADQNRGASTTSQPDETRTENKSQADETNFGERIDNESSLDDPEIAFSYHAPKMALFKGWEGVAVMLFGVVLPALLVVAGFVGCYDRIAVLLLKQPVETLVELALLTIIPIANLTVWAALCANDCRYSIRRGVLNGMALGAATIVGLISGIAILLRYPTVSSNGVKHGAEFLSITLVSLGAVAVSAFLLKRVRQTRILSGSKIRATAYAVAGVVLALVAFVASEARSTCIRIAEFMAVSEKKTDRQQGLDFLRALNPEKDLRMECSNSNVAGIPGLFIKLDTVTLRQLHFAVLGKPFRDTNAANFTSMPDDYLKAHVVGTPVEGLSLHRSAIYGHVNPETVSSTLYWTFVLKNTNYDPQEARAELLLPEGAVISGMTVWRDGRAQRTTFAATLQERENASWTYVGHDAPGIVTDLGRGRMLLHCYPVPAQDSLRVSIAVTIPLKLHTITEASLPLPRFIDTNFSLEGEHGLRIISSNGLKLASSGVTSEKTKTGENVLAGNLTKDSLAGAGLSIRVARPPVLGPVVARDGLASPSRYLVQTIRQIPAQSPNKLVVVLDGSEVMKEQLDALRKVLDTVPKNIPASLIVASEGSSDKPVVSGLSEGLRKLKPEMFIGGQDNLHAVVKATEIAGDTAGGAVLWIHGPQPSFNKEIYLMSPFAKTPSFFELALDNGMMDANEYFKNHRDIGPFAAVARNGSPKDDLERFLAKWHPGGHEFIIEYQAFNKAPGGKQTNVEQAQEIATLYAREECIGLLRRGDVTKATDVAVYHRIVSPVSLAASVASPENTTNDRLAYEDGDRSVRILEQNASQPISFATQNSRPTQAGAVGGGTYARQAGGHFTGRQTGVTASAATASPEAAVEGSAISSADASAPIMQSATNGTIGPQGAYAYQIMGVNTAGTVRVNNLANLEAVLNIFANLIEVALVVIGILLCASAPFPVPENGKRSVLPWGSMSKEARITFGVTALFLGLMTPGVINYLVASARDANLFS